MREFLIDEAMLWPKRSLVTESDPKWLRFLGDLLQCFDEEAHYYAAMGYGDPDEQTAEPSHAPWREFWTVVLPAAAAVVWAEVSRRLFGTAVCRGCGRRATTEFFDHEPACAPCFEQTERDAIESAYARYF